MAATIATIDLEANRWTRVDNLFPNDLVTLRNIGGTPVSVYMTSSTSTNINTLISREGIDPIEIGGAIYEVSSHYLNEEQTQKARVWVKAIDTTGRISVRIKGTIDPSEDLTVVANSLNDLTAAYNAHITNFSNPHKVTKAQVKLGNLPNAISDAVDEDTSEKLATAKAVKTVNDSLNAHTARTDNPHSVTKAQVGLSKVANYAPANESTAVDKTNNSVYMTPAMTYKAVSQWVVGVNTHAQTIVQANMATARPSGWTIGDCSLPTLAVTKVNNTTYRVNKNLKVCYADSGVTKISGALVSAFDKTILNADLHAVTAESNIIYIYVDIDENGIISSTGYTLVKPTDGCQRMTTYGDFYNYTDNTMYSSENLPIRRVYVGKAYINLSTFAINDIIPVPIGSEYYYPITVNLEVGNRFKFESPFICTVDTTAEMYNVVREGFNNTLINYWGETKWNDQIGVMASPWPIDPINGIIVQVGYMGFLASGYESGSPFGVLAETVSRLKSTNKLRVRIKKRY